MPRGWAGRGALSDALAVTMLTWPIVQFQRQGKDLEKVKQRLIEIANHVDKVRSFPGNYVTQIVYMFGNQVGDDAHLVCLSREPGATSGPGWTGDSCPRSPEPRGPERLPEMPATLPDCGLGHVPPGPCWPGRAPALASQTPR